MKSVFAVSAALGAFCAFADAESRQTVDSASFAKPPAECRPRCWWHWMNGNVTKEGIVRDLSEMAKVGIGGATIFDLGGGVVAGPVEGYSPAWYEHVRFAGEEAAKRGIDLAVHNCAGWTASGAPWITPENSMKRLMVSDVVLEPGQTFKGKFPVNGEVPKGWIKEISLIAYPAPPAEKPAPPAVDFVREGTNRYVLTLPAPCDVTGFEFRHRPNTVWTWMQSATFKVETSVDGGAWKPVADLKLELFNNGFPLAREERLAVPLGKEVRASRFRFTFDAPNDLGNFYELAELRLTCDSKIVPDVKARSLAFRQGFAPIPDKPDAAVDSKGERLDVSRFLKPDGTFEWTAPVRGRLWIVQRTAAVSTGAMNGPAAGGRQGLECDKLDKKGIDAVYEGYVGKLKGMRGIKEVLCDSWEVGSQNWTDSLPAEFAARRGYALDRFWPAFSGRVVDTPEATEKFFRDWRKTIAELFTENYSDRFRDLAHRDGLKYQCEPYGNSPADQYAYARSADLPMSEFWTYEPARYAAGRAVDENTFPDESCIRRVASAVHFHGKAFADAESFTCAPGACGKWRKGLSIHKACGDAALAAGVNRFTYHSLAHQPWGDRYVPGATMNVFGTISEINSPTWSAMKPMVAYHTRLHYLLSRGRSTSRLLYVAPDDQLAEFPRAAFPGDVSYDVVGADDAALVKVERGRVFAPSGAEYEALVLADDAAYEYASAAQAKRFRESGARMFRDDETAFAGVTRDFSCSGTAARVRAIRRDYADGACGFFVACPDTNAVTLACSFAVSGRFPELWDPETGRRFRIADFREEGGRTRIDLPLEACGSAFVLFSPRKDETIPVFRPFQNAKTVLTLSRFTLTFPSGRGCGGPYALDKPVSWTTLGGETQYFSGTATYDAEAAFPEVGNGRRVMLDLGDVRETAEVFFDGKLAGVLWKPPYRVDLTDALAASGKTVHAIRIKVSNTWANRLIGDAKKPDDCVWWENDWRAGLLKEIPDWVKQGKPSPTGRHTFSIVRHYKGGEPLLPAGLLGPMRILVD
ncbi:MAG: hypothetical protein MJ138_04220 [Kiritimatiellae bacterium]|nr:hypothetical protein [Kiritimatiellia bacterium]